MTVDQFELSDYSGSPERLFFFQMGNVVWGYTNSTKPKVYNSVVYEPLTIDMGSIAQALSEDSPTLEIRLDAQAGVAKQFIPYQPIFPIRVRVYRHHVEDPDGEYLTEMIGEVINATFDESDGMAAMNVRMFVSNLDRRVPWPAYQKQCNHALYGPGCRVDRFLYRTVAPVTLVNGAEIQASEFGIVAQDKNDPVWFVNGYVTNQASGESRFIIGQEGVKLFLQAPFVDLLPGDIVEAFAGCDRLRDTCLNKFNNLPRHLGFPYVPEKNPFTDSVYGNQVGGASGSSSQSGTNSSALIEGSN